jgi:hypothetical protein
MDKMLEDLIPMMSKVYRKRRWLQRSKKIRNFVVNLKKASKFEKRKKFIRSTSRKGNN